MFTIRTKLIATCVILLALQASVVLLGLYELSASNTRLDDTLRGPAATARLAAQLRSAMAKMSRAQRDLMLASNERERNTAAAQVDVFVKDRDEVRQQLVFGKAGSAAAARAIGAVHRDVASAETHETMLVLVTDVPGMAASSPRRRQTSRRRAAASTSSRRSRGRPMTSAPRTTRARRSPAGRRSTARSARSAARTPTTTRRS